jgi:RNA polymerase sigma-70 factor (ECF subfamily)
MDALYGAAIRLVRNPADAEDLLADTVAKAWVSIESLSDHDRFRPWIFRILRNQFISDYRKRSVRPSAVSLDHEAGPDEGEDLLSLLNQQSDEFLVWWADPERDLTNRLLGEEIEAALGRLPEAFRITIQLVTADGLSYDEAAELLGVPPGTVRSRMKRGRTLLQKALWEHARDAGIVSGSGSQP